MDITIGLYDCTTGSLSMQTAAPTPSEITANSKLSSFVTVSGQSVPILVLSFTQYDHTTYDVDISTRFINSIS